jgi:hypothetical protein
MHRHIIAWHGTLAILLGVASGALADPPGKPSKVKSIPPFSEVQKTVWQHFQGQGDFQPVDLITREQVEPLLAQLERMGLPLPDAKQILDKLPAKGDFLVEQFCAPGGRKFMRRVAAAPNMYDRLDRLSQMPQGQQTIRGMINSPGGEKTVDYMMKSPNGVGIGKILSSGSQAEQFGAPTGRIYTIDALLTRLQQSHAAAVKASSAAPSSVR